MPLGSDSSLNTLVHPKLHRSLSRVFPSWVTVQRTAETQGDDNAVLENWQDIPGLTTLRGILAAAGANEIRKAQMTNVKITHVLDLQSYRPEITVKNRVRVSRAMGESGETYNVTGVKHDSQAASSRLELELVSG
jgi:head-tail adaptor